MPLLSFTVFRSKRNKNTRTKTSKKDGSKRKKKKSIFRQKSANQNLQLQKGLTWTNSEDSSLLESVFGEKPFYEEKQRKTQFKTSNIESLVELMNRHEQEVEDLKIQHEKDFARKEIEFLSLEKVQKQSQARLAEFEQQLSAKERKLVKTQEELIAVRNDLCNVSAHLIQTQRKLHDLSASWPFSFWVNGTD